MRLRLAALLASAALPVVALPATAIAQQEPVGGALLGSSGVVVQRLPGAPALPRGLSASSWLVADADTGEVLAARAPHVRHRPASTLKVLTAVTLLPRLDPAQMVRTSYDDAAVDGSKVGLVPGMRYSVDTLFASMLVVSANDAAGALAEAAGGTRRTVGLMNAEARHLQALDTHARTPSGLDAAGETTSAYDLALIAREGLQMPAFRHYVGIVMRRVPAPHHKRYQIYTHDQLLTSYRGMIGGKNGYTVKAAGTFVGAARRGGHTILISLMHAPPDFWAQAKSLLDWGFAAEGRVTPVGTLVGPAEPPSSSTATTSDSHSRTTVVLSGHRSDNPVQTWQLVALGASAAIAIAVTTRRQRRRDRRLSLPPL
jgi:serine-type D-Ala-D-Ala carboxypeptidase (penicillin-binding protein 5/6)